MYKAASWRKWYSAGGLMGLRSCLCNLKVLHFREEGLTQSSPSSSNIVFPPNFYLIHSCPKVAVGWRSDGFFFFLVLQAFSIFVAIRGWGGWYGLKVFAGYLSRCWGLDENEEGGWQGHVTLLDAHHAFKQSLAIQRL